MFSAPQVNLYSQDVVRSGDVAPLLAAGARALSQPHDWLGTLRVTWVADPDDNPIEFVQRRR